MTDTTRAPVGLPTPEQILADQKASGLRPAPWEFYRPTQEACCGLGIVCKARFPEVFARLRPGGGPDTYWEAMAVALNVSFDAVQRFSFGFDRGIQDRSAEDPDPSFQVGYACGLALRGVR